MLMSAGCKNRNAAEALQQNDRTMYLTAEDTLTVKSMVENYMDQVVNGNLKGAVEMLSVSDASDIEDEPWPLDKSQQTTVMESLKSFAVSDYEITDMTFRRAHDNEVKCKVLGDGGLSTNWCFRPVRYLGKWHLCLQNSFGGNK